MPRPKKVEKTPGSGRQPNTPNKFTSTVKQHVLTVFQQFQETKAAHSLAVWGKNNPEEFYKIAARLIPTEVNATVTEVKLSVNRKKGEANQTPEN